MARQKKKTTKKGKVGRLSKKAESVRATLAKSKKNWTYGELAKKHRTVPMAIGQIMKGLKARGHGNLTKRVKAAA